MYNNNNNNLFTYFRPRHIVTAYLPYLLTYLLTYGWIDI